MRCLRHVLQMRVCQHSCQKVVSVCSKNRRTFRRNLLSWAKTMYRRHLRGRSRRDYDRRWPNLDVPAGRSSHKQNGQRRFSWRDSDESASIPSCLGMFVDVYRHHAAVFARYRAEGRCSEKQLRTIEALYIEGMSLHEFAVLEDVSPQAIGDRINALANKAPEFCRWWRNTNASHQRPPNVRPLDR